ncbi:MAG: hypothetical protein ACE5IJ_09735 [Thermoplasmata archaeon]
MRMAKKEREIVNQTIDFWQPLSNSTITPDDARVIIENVTQFFQILGEWDRQGNRLGIEPDNEPALMEADR